MDQPDQDATQQADQPVEQADAAASGSSQESESGWMNRAIRTVAGFFGADDEASGTDREQQAAETEATSADAQQGTQPDEAAIQERIRREAQSLKDRELVRERRSWAQQRAEQGDVEPLRQLAERGDPWAQRTLAEHGETFALGEIKAKELRAQTQAEGMHEQVAGLAGVFDGAYLEPLLAALPDQAQAHTIRSETVGIEGRQQAVGTVLTSLRKHWQSEAVTKALNDEGFVTDLLKSDGFRSALVKNPVANKRFRAYFRGELDEPDHNPGVGPGRGGERESDVMGALIAAEAGFVRDRAPGERAAMAGGTNGRATHRDLLDDE